MSTFIKAEKVVSTALGLLLREVTLPQFVWRDAVGDFAGAKNDTISIRLPAYAPARTRLLRSGAARVKDNIHQRKVDVTLDTDVYKDIGITDEELSLDIANFGLEILTPVVQGIGLELEQEIADEISGATYQTTLTYTAGTDDPYTDVALVARSRLNAAHVPLQGRVLLVGSTLEAEMLGHSKFIDLDANGVMRNGVIGRIAGFDVVSSPAIAPNEAYAFHRTAYAMGQRAPVVPAGAPWGASQSYQGLAIRTVRVFDPNLVEDRFVADAWVGVNTVADVGHFDADPAGGGRFVPVTDPGAPVAGAVNVWENDTARLVRAVKITVV